MEKNNLNIKFPPKSKIVNPSFIGLIDNFDRFLIAWGGRGSGKSTSIARKLLIDCLRLPYFRCIALRKVKDTLKDSVFKQLKEEAEAMKISQFFEFRVSPLEIRCLNGNGFLFRGMDEPRKIKSVKDPTHAWYEEGNEFEEKDFITVTTSIRTKKGTVLQEIFTLNSDVDGNYEDFWFWKMFFKIHHPELEFSDIIEVNVNGEIFKYTVTAHHSTYKDNPKISGDFIAFLENLKVTNPYYYDVWCKGLWGSKTVEARFWKGFQIGKNVSNMEYLPHLPLHISFDFNVNPYITLTIHQSEGLNSWQIDELCLESPKNTSSKLTKEFCNKYKNHESSIFVYGDPAGRQRSTRSQNDDDVNDYAIIFAELNKHFNSRLIHDRVLRSAPSVSASKDFINSIFEVNLFGIDYKLNEICNNSKNDFLYLKEAPDGGKLIQKVNDKEKGYTYEKYGHTSDSIRYFLCAYYESQYKQFLSKGKGFNATVIVPNYNNSQNVF